MSKVEFEQTLFWHAQFADQLPFSVPGKWTRRRSGVRKPARAKKQLHQAQSIAGK
jgi:hypothetical protein